TELCCRARRRGTGEVADRVCPERSCRPGARSRGPRPRGPSYRQQVRAVAGDDFPNRNRRRLAATTVASAATSDRVVPVARSSRARQGEGPESHRAIGEACAHHTLGLRELASTNAAAGRKRLLPERKRIFRDELLGTIRIRTIFSAN